MTSSPCSCASAEFCAAGDNDGDIFTSTDPLGGRWHVDACQGRFGQLDWGDLVSHDDACAPPVTPWGDEVASTDPTEWSLGLGYGRSRT